MKKKIIKCKTSLDLDYFAQVPGLKVNFTKNYKMFRFVQKMISPLTHENKGN